MQKSIVLRGRRLCYELVRKRIRSVNLRVRADGSLSVSAPQLTPAAVIESLIQSRADWILAQLARREAAAAERENAVWLAGERLPVVLRQGGCSGVKTENGALILTLRDPSDAQERRRALENWQKRLCAEQVTALCRRYYPAFERRGVAFPTLSFRRMTSRWGSCRPQKGALSFNTRLTELPPGCADYVVVHEFAHFLQPNHAPAFYAEVARVLPDWQRRRAALKAWEKSHPFD